MRDFSCTKTPFGVLKKQKQNIKGKKIENGV